MIRNYELYLYVISPEGRAKARAALPCGKKWSHDPRSSVYTAINKILEADVLSGRKMTCSLQHWFRLLAVSRLSTVQGGSHLF